MNDRFRALLAFAFMGFASMALAVTLAVPAHAQAPELQPPGAEPQPVEPPADLPRPQRGDPTQNLDRLFTALRVAPSAESAKFIEGRIWATWAAQGGDTATLLMSRVRDRHRRQGLRTRDQAPDRDHRHQARLYRSLEPACDALLSQARLHVGDERPAQCAHARASALRRLGRAWHDPATMSATSGVRWRRSAARSNCIRTWSGFPT